MEKPNLLTLRSKDPQPLNIAFKYASELCKPEDRGETCEKRSYFANILDGTWLSVRQEQIRIASFNGAKTYSLFTTSAPDGWKGTVPYLGDLPEVGWTCSVLRNPSFHVVEGYKNYIELKLMLVLECVTAEVFLFPVDNVRVQFYSTFGLLTSVEINYVDSVTGGNQPVSKSEQDNAIAKIRGRLHLNENDGVFISTIAS